MALDNESLTVTIAMTLEYSIGVTVTQEKRHAIGLSVREATKCGTRYIFFVFRDLTLYLAFGRLRVGMGQMGRRNTTTDGKVPPCSTEGLDM